MSLSMYHPTQLRMKSALEIKMNVVAIITLGILNTMFDSIIRKHILFGQTKEKIDFSLK